MTSGEGILNCANCKIFEGDEICPSVALNSIAQLVGSGYRHPGGEELTIKWLRTQGENPDVQPVLAENCMQRKNYDKSISSGFGAVTY
jgi:hypothetical protein